MLLHDMEEAVKEAENIQRNSDKVTKQLAKLLVGRLRQVNTSGLWMDNEILKNLKRELKDFNMRTGKWNNE